jgi:hypothetical protein
VAFAGQSAKLLIVLHSWLDQQLNIAISWLRARFLCCVIVQTGESSRGIQAFMSRISKMLAVALSIRARSNFIGRQFAIEEENYFIGSSATRRRWLSRLFSFWTVRGGAPAHCGL